ncbi:hypothetical protein ES708_08990 [subsurface metagenome]
MGRSGQEFIAATEGSQFTLYAACEAMGIPLTEEQKKFQRYLERKYPKKEVMPSDKGEQPRSTSA